MKKTIFALLLTVFAPVFFVNIAAQGPGEPVLTKLEKAAISETFVIRDPPGNVYAGADAAICAGEDYYISDAGVVGLFSITWYSSGDGFFDDITILTPTYTPGPEDKTSGTVTLTLTVQPGGHSDSMTLTIYPLPLAPTVDGNDPICFGDDAIFTITGTPGLLVTYEIDGNEATITIDTGGTVHVTVEAATEDQTITITEVEDDNCILVGLNIQHTIVVHPLPEVPTVDGNDPICFGDDAIFTITGTPGLLVTYEIDGNEATITIDTGGTVHVTVEAATEDQTITITEVEDDNCILVGLNIQHTIVVHPLPEVPSVAGNDPICSGDDAIFTITGTPGLWVTYEIDGSEAIITIGTGGTVDVIVAAATVDQVITITKVEDDNCILEDLEIEHTILVNELPQFTIEGPNMVCPNLKNAEYEADITNFPLSDIELPPEWVVINGDIENKDSNKAWISWHNKPGEQGKITLTVINKHTGCEQTLFDQPITFSGHHQAPEPEDIVNKTLNDKTIILIYPEPNLEYQWFKNDTEVTGENGQYYYPGSNGFSPGDVYKVLVAPLNVNDFVCGNFSEPVTILEPKLYDFIPQNLFLMYPNPAGDHIIIVLNEEHNNMSYDNCKAIIYNESGELLKSKSLNQWENQLSVSELSAGIYLVAIWVNGKRDIKRMIKN